MLKGVLGAVADALLRPGRAVGDVRVFQQIQRFGKATGAEVDGFHELVDAGVYAASQMLDE